LGNPNSTSLVAYLIFQIIYNSRIPHRVKVGKSYSTCNFGLKILAADVPLIYVEPDDAQNTSNTPHEETGFQGKHPIIIGEHAKINCCGSKNDDKGSEEPEFH